MMAATLVPRWVVVSLMPRGSPVEPDVYCTKEAGWPPVAHLPDGWVEAEVARASKLVAGGRSGWATSETTLASATRVAAHCWAHACARPAR